MRWSLSWRADPGAARIADRHYNRQSPGSPQFVPPGRCIVLRAPDALWVTSWPLAEYVHHDWAGAWINSVFRRESDASGALASELIREAVAATRWAWPDVPTLGMVSFVDEGQTRDRRSKRALPGRCYEAAGFRHVGFTREEHLWAWQLLPADMPAAEAPRGATLPIFDEERPT